MVYTKKKYLKELETNPYWEVEPHFFYWSLFELFKHFETILKNKMSPEDFQSAMYGEFVIKGKPMRDGFIQNFNLTLKWLNKIIDKEISDETKKKM